IDANHSADAEMRHLLDNVAATAAQPDDHDGCSPEKILARSAHHEGLAGELRCVSPVSPHLVATPVVEVAAYHSEREVGTRELAPDGKHASTRGWTDGHRSVRAAGLNPPEYF